MRYANILHSVWLLLALSACSSRSPIMITETVEAKLPEPAAMASEVPDPNPVTPPIGAATQVEGPSQEVPASRRSSENEITFEKTLGGSGRDRGINLVQTSDGGYAIVGYTSSPPANREDVYLVRMDQQGEVLWSRTYGGGGQDNGWDVLETEDGGYLIVGFTSSFGAGALDVYLIRTDASGNMLWDHTYGGPKSEYGWSMAQASDGGYVLAGQTDSFGSGDKDGYLVKVDAEGEEIWAKTYGGAQEDRLFSIDQSADAGFVLAGTTTSFGAGSRDAFLVKTDSSGEQLRMAVFGEGQDDVGHSVRQTDDGGFIVTGYTKSFGAKNYDTWLVKTDATGNSIWQKLFGELGDDRTIYGEQTDDGGYISTGYTKSFDAAGWDVFLVRTDSSGEVTWYKTYGGRAEDTGYTVKPTTDGGFILTGETYSSGEGGGDMYVIKVNQDGEVIGNGE